MESCQRHVVSLCIERARERVSHLQEFTRGKAPVHIITIACVCSQIQYKSMTISLYRFSEHASFFLISKVFLFFAQIYKQIRVLCCLWLLGSEETESDPVRLCDSGAKIIPLGNARVGKVEKLSTRTLRNIHDIICGNS